MRWIAVIAASAALVVGCTHNGIQGALIPGSASPSSSSLSSISSATTSGTNSNPVKGTTFDACSSITDADVATWKVDPANKRDAHQTAFGQRVRGCIWDGPKWGVKVYAVDGSIAQFGPPKDRWDRHEQVAIGTRTGWLLHTQDGATCAIVIPSQDALAAVQVDLNLDLTRQHYDQCPLALQIMKQIEPKIP